MRTLISLRGLALHALIALAGFALASPAAAAPSWCGAPGGSICYDDEVGTLFSWTGIQETIQSADDAPGTPLDGLFEDPALLDAAGNNLFFDPSSFDATNSFAAGGDLTHSTLNITLSALSAAAPIEVLSIQEFGDHTFLGAPNPAHTVSATIGGTVTVTGIASGASATLGQTFGIVPTAVNAPNSIGIGGGFLQQHTALTAGTFNWSIDYDLDLTGLGITEVEIQLNNILSSSATAAGSASIQKKVALTVTPEPSTAVLTALGLVGLAASRKSKTRKRSV